MNTALWSKKALAIPACTALIVGGITLSATAAHADPADFAVTNTSVSGQVLTVTGTGTPGENVILQKGFPAERHEIPADGNWTITYTLPDQAQHTYEVDQQNGINADGSTTITVQAEQVAPDFAITSHTVSGRTVTVSGTGNPDDTVQIDPQSAPIVRHQIADDGTWSFTFDIPGTDTDEHTYNVLEQNSNFQTQDQGSFTAAAEATTPEFAITSHSVSGRTVTVSGTGNPDNTVQIDPQSAPIVRHQIADDGTWSFTFDIPGTDTDEHTYNVLEENNGFQIQAQGSFTVAAEASATDPESQFSLISPEDGSTVDSRTVTFTGTGTPGDSVNVLNEDGTRAAPQVLVGDDGNWTTTGTFSDSADRVQNLSVNQVGGGQGQGTVDFTITLPAVAVTPGDGGNGDGGNGGTGNGGTGTGTGTGNAGTGTGTGAAGTGPAAGAPALPVVSG